MCAKTGLTNTDTLKERLINAFGFAEMAVRAVVWLPFRARSATFVYSLPHLRPFVCFGVQN